MRTREPDLAGSPGNTSMERPPTTNVDPAESPEAAGNAEPEEMPEFGFTDDELESMTLSTDPALRAILGRC